MVFVCLMGFLERVPINLQLGIRGVGCVEECDERSVMVRSCASLG